MQNLSSTYYASTLADHHLILLISFDYFLKFVGSTRFYHLKSTHSAWKAMQSLRIINKCRNYLLKLPFCNLSKYVKLTMDILYKFTTEIYLNLIVSCILSFLIYLYYLNNNRVYLYVIFLWLLYFHTPPSGCPQ